MEPPATTACKKPAASLPLPLPPALFLVRARSRASRVADLDDAFSFAAAPAWAPGPPDTPPRRSPVTVPFLWEDAPGKPKAVPAAVPAHLQGDGGGDREDKAHAAAEEARPVPVKLKLPPRLQQVPPHAAADAKASLLSPKSVLQGPYYGCAGGGGRRPPRRARSGAFRRTPSAGIGLFSRTLSKPMAAAAGPDAPSCSPAPSSASSSSLSSSMSATCFGEDHHAHGGNSGEEDDDSSTGTGSVRITRFRRSRSLPSITASHLWASIRRNIKQITPWS